MERFEVKDIHEWAAIGNETLVFDCFGKKRVVQFDVVSTGRIDVYASYVKSSSKVLVASGKQFDCKLSIDQDVELTFVLEKGHTAAFRSGARQQHVKHEPAEKFTVLEIKRSQNPEFDAMMLIMNENQRARDERVQNELNELRNKFAEGLLTQKDLPKGVVTDLKKVEPDGDDTQGDVDKKPAKGGGKKEPAKKDEVVDNDD